MSRKICVIVGAGEGLGMGIARKFGREQFQIALLARNVERLNHLVELLAEDGIEARAFWCDVHDHASIAKAFNAIREDFGPIEVVSYSPEPHTPPKDLREWLPMTMTLAEVERRMRLSCYGAIVCAQHVLPDMIERGSGTILVTTSGSGIEPIKTLCAVGMSMSAARNFVLSLNQQLQGKGVYVGSVNLSVLIESGSEHGDPDKLAETYWSLHVERDRPEVIIAPFDVHKVHEEDMHKYQITMPAD